MDSSLIALTVVGSLIIFAILVGMAAILFYRQRARGSNDFGDVNAEEVQYGDWMSLKYEVSSNYQQKMKDFQQVRNFDLCEVTIA